MKTVIVIIAFVFTITLFYNYAYSKTIWKIWTSSNTELADWHYKWKDEWNGYNYQCCDEGNWCQKWSWQAIYFNLVPTSPDPCPQINFSGYGENLSRTEAINNGYQWPIGINFSFSMYDGD